MFYIGSNVADWPNEAQRGLADGHQICVHTWSHPYMTTLTNQQVLGELYYTKKVIKYVVGVTPLCWRPVRLGFMILSFFTALPLSYVLKFFLFQ